MHVAAKFQDAGAGSGFWDEGEGAGEAGDVLGEVGTGVFIRHGKGTQGGFGCGEKLGIEGFGWGAWGGGV